MQACRHEEGGQRWGVGEQFRAPTLCEHLPLLGLRCAICHTRVLTLQPLRASWWMC